MKLSVNVLMLQTFKHIDKILVCRKFWAFIMLVLVYASVIEADDVAPLKSNNEENFNGNQTSTEFSVMNNGNYSESEFNNNRTTNDFVKKKEYKIAGVEFHRIETPFIIGIWIFCASVAKVVFHWAPRLNQEVPESCLLIVVGVVIGLALLLLDHIHITPLTPDTFFLYMLPPIIFDAGYFMPNRLFFDNIGTILMFAVIGTIFNTMAIGGSLWLLSKMNVYGSEVPLLEIFVFSSLISAVDPVAVLSVFEEIHVNEILYIVVFGESLLNDAVTVVLYHTFETYNEMGVSNILYTDILSGMVSFGVVAMGGTFIGLLWGFLTGFITRFTRTVRVVEPIIIFVMAYLAYLNAEMFHMSGILAITFCGISMKNYVEGNISYKSHTTIKYTMKMMSSSSETIIFMFLGVSTVSEQHDWNTPFVLCTIFFCSVYRLFSISVLTSLVNQFRLHKLNTVDKFVMSYGGLRGAVAFALALLINSEHVKHKSMFVTTTIAVIYFTVFVQGISIRPLVKILNVQTAEKRKPTMNERIHERFMDHMMAGIEDILGHHGNHTLRDKFKRFDMNFIRPYLIREYRGQEPKIMETFSKLAMKDAIEIMRRNASTLGNMSNNSESAPSAILTPRNNVSISFDEKPRRSITSQVENGTNIDLQEYEYNLTRKDLSDAKIHHLLAEELRQPPRRHRRLSYSRHTVDERDFSAQVNYRLHTNTRQMVAPDQHRHHHSHRRSKKNKDGKVNHVSFHSGQQNPYPTSSTGYEECDDKQFYYEDHSDGDDGITFTAPPSPEKRDSCTYSASSLSYLEQYINEHGYHDDYDDDDPAFSIGSKVVTPAIAEVSLPWRRSDSEEQEVQSVQGSCEKKFPWKRSGDDSDIESGTVKQNEFPLWVLNKDYLAYSSPSNTYLGGIEKTQRLASVIGFFRRGSHSNRSSVSNNAMNVTTAQPTVEEMPSRFPLSTLYTSLVNRCRDSKANNNSSSPRSHHDQLYLNPFSSDQIGSSRRTSMMELSSSSRSAESDLFRISLMNAGCGNNHRVRSGSECLPYREQKRTMSINDKWSSSVKARISSSSSSSSSDDSIPFT